MVHRSGGRVVILQVAGRAGRGGQVVVVVDVAVETDTWRISVRVGQREANRVVVERCWLPSAGVVALLAGLREISSYVIWILGPLVIRQMAAYACCGGQVVVVIDVAVQADPRRIGVRIRQREAGAGVIEFGVQPGVRAMALFAIR